MERHFHSISPLLIIIIKFIPVKLRPLKTRQHHSGISLRIYGAFTIFSRNLLGKTCIDETPSDYDSIEPSQLNLHRLSSVISDSLQRLETNVRAITLRKWRFAPCTKRASQR